MKYALIFRRKVTESGARLIALFCRMIGQNCVTALSVPHQRIELRYTIGVMPVVFLKSRMKYEWSLKPKL